MSMVQLVNGQIDSSKLGRTLMHEHFCFGYVGFEGDRTLGGFKEDEYTEICKKMVADARAYGVETIVDATTNECGRNVRFIKKMADLTGINVVCSTGYYFQAESSFKYWEFRQGFGDVDKEIYDMLCYELTKGIEGTDVKAGAIKLASSLNEITPMEERFFKAAAKAQKETGCIIITHTQTGTMGPEQADLLTSEGADPGKIAIGHMCGNLDPDYHEKVLKYGVFDNLDRFGLEGPLFKTPYDSERMDLIVELVKRGWGDKLLLGHDSVNVFLGRDFKLTDIVPDANIRTIGCKILPGLKERGLSDVQIEKLMTDNPRAIFS